MGYSSEVTDSSWEIIEPLLPTKKKRRPPVWTCTANSELDILSTQEWLQLGRFTQRFTALFDCVVALQTVCEDGILARIVTELHGRVREQVKKNHSGRF